MTAVKELVQAHTAHARFEEEQFLPLAQAVLSRNGNHMDALGLSLHLRHAPQLTGHILGVWCFCHSRIWCVILLGFQLPPLTRRHVLMAAAAAI